MVLFAFFLGNVGRLLGEKHVHLTTTRVVIFVLGVRWMARLFVLALVCAALRLYSCFLFLRFLPLE